MFTRLVRRAVVFEGLETTLDPAPYPTLDPEPLFGEPIGAVFRMQPDLLHAVGVWALLIPAIVLTLPVSLPVRVPHSKNGFTARLPRSMTGFDAELLFKHVYAGLEVVDVPRVLGFRKFFAERIRKVGFRDHGVCDHRDVRLKVTDVLVESFDVTLYWPEVSLRSHVLSDFEVVVVNGGGKVLQRHRFLFCGWLFHSVFLNHTGAALFVKSLCLTRLQ